MNLPDLSIFNPSWDGANETLCVNVYNYYNWWNDFKSLEPLCNNVDFLKYLLLGLYSLLLLYHLFLSIKSREYLFLLNADKSGRNLQLYVYLLFSSISFFFHFILLIYIFSHTCNRSWPKLLFISSQTFELLIMKPIYLFVLFEVYKTYQEKGLEIFYFLKILYFIFILSIPFTFIVLVLSFWISFKYLLIILEFSDFILVIIYFFWSKILQKFYKSSYSYTYYQEILLDILHCKQLYHENFVLFLFYFPANFLLWNKIKLISSFPTFPKFFLIILIFLYIILRCKYFLNIRITTLADCYESNCNYSKSIKKNENYFPEILTTSFPERTKTRFYIINTKTDCIICKTFLYLNERLSHCAIESYKNNLFLMGGLHSPDYYNIFFKFVFSNILSYKTIEMPKLLSKKAKMLSAYNSNKIYIIGGSNEINDIGLKDFESFNLITKRWTKLPDFPIRVLGFNSSCIIFNKSILYVNARYSIYRFDLLKNDTWTSINLMDNNRFNNLFIVEKFQLIQHSQNQLLLFSNSRHSLYDFRTRNLKTGNYFQNVITRNSELIGKASKDKLYLHIDNESISWSKIKEFKINRLTTK